MKYSNFSLETVLDDDEYLSHVEDLLYSDELRKLQNIVHHKHTNRFRHSLFVSYRSFNIAKKHGGCDLRAVARGGLLHDLFYETRLEIEKLGEGSHNFVHPKIALKNAEKLTELNEIEKDIILKHMFLCTKCKAPKYKESFIVSMVDKYCAISEVFEPTRNKIKEALLVFTF